MEPSLIAIAVGLPLVAVVGAIAFGRLSRGFERFDAQLTRDWSDRVGKALRAMPEFDSATNGVTDGPIPIFVWRGITVVAERDAEEEHFGPPRFGLTVTGNPMLRREMAGIRLRVATIAHAPGAAGTIAVLGLKPASRPTAVVLAELFRHAQSRAEAAPGARAGTAGSRLGITR